MLKDGCSMSQQHWRNMVPNFKKKGKLLCFVETENSEYKCLFMWGFRRKSYRAQPPGLPDAISLHSLWGRTGWQRNCINLVSVKTLITKGFVSLTISYNYSSLALGNSQSILMPEDHMWKGVSRRSWVRLIDHSSCGAPAFVQISTVGEGMATVFVNLRKYCWCSALKQPPSPPFTSGGVVLSLMDRGQEVRADPLPWLTAKFLCYSSEREVQGLDERQQRSHCGSFKFCQGVVDQGKRFLFYFPCGKSHWRS